MSDTSLTSKTIVDRLRHLRQFEWTKARDDCIGNLTVGEERQALAEIERLTAERDELDREGSNLHEIGKGLELACAQLRTERDRLRAGLESVLEQRTLDYAHTIARVTLGRHDGAREHPLGPPDEPVDDLCDECGGNGDSGNWYGDPEVPGGTAGLPCQKCNGTGRLPREPSARLCPNADCALEDGHDGPCDAEPEEHYDCPIHGLQDGPDCPRC